VPLNTNFVSHGANSGGIPYAIGFKCSHPIIKFVLFAALEIEELVLLFVSIKCMIQLKSSTHSVLVVKMEVGAKVFRRGCCKPGSRSLQEVIFHGKRALLIWIDPDTAKFVDPVKHAPEVHE